MCFDSSLVRALTVLWALAVLSSPPLSFHGGQHSAEPDVRQERPEGQAEGLKSEGHAIAGDRLSTLPGIRWSDLHRERKGGALGREAGFCPVLDYPSMVVMLAMVPMLEMEVMMARVPEGKRLLQVMVSLEVAQTIRAMAAMDAVPLGQVIEQAILATNVRKGVMELLEKPVVKAGPLAKVEPQETPSNPKPMRVPEMPSNYEGKRWDQVRLNAAMALHSLSGSQMSKKLISRTGGTPNKEQVLRWRNGKENIPARYWSQLEKLFAGDE